MKIYTKNGKENEIYMDESIKEKYAKILEMEQELTGDLTKSSFDKMNNIEVDEVETTNETGMKLAKIFGNKNLSYYGESDDGRIILGYKKDTEGNKIPIYQDKVSRNEVTNYGLRIEVPLEDYSDTKDNMGLTPEERKRYNKLKAMNTKNGSPRTDEELLAKAKTISDLDSEIIPDMMMYFLTEEEDTIGILSEEDRENIKRLRNKGLMIEPAAIAGVNETIALVSMDGSIHMMEFFKWLSRKGYSMDGMSKQKLDELTKEYRRETRPSLEMVIDAQIISCRDKLKDKLKMLDNKLNSERSDEELNALANRLKYNRIDRRRFVKDCVEKGTPLFDYDDMNKLNVYFRVYGLHREDSIQFNSTYIADPKAGVNMGTKLNEFKLETGLDFGEAYYYYWETIAKENNITFEDDEENINEDSSEPEPTEEERLAMLGSEIPDEFDDMSVFETDDNDLELI